MLKVGLVTSTILVGIMMFLSTSMILNYFIMFIIGVLSTARLSITIIYVMECCRASFENSIGSGFNFADGF